MSDVETVRHLSPPPRALPLDLSVRVVLGSMLGQVGWFLVGFGLVFVWAFDADGAIVSAFRFLGEEAIADGTVTSWRELNLSINETQVYETSYEFDVDGRRYTGASYATGYYVPEGTQVMVEHRPSNPAASRIQGMRASAAGLPVAFVLVIPFIGLAFARAGLRGGLRARRLLAEGHLAQATLESDEGTGMEVKERPVRKLTFSFTTDSGQTCRVSAMTHDAAKLRDEETERVVYDPRYPSDAVLLDDLPGRPEIDARGNFVSGGVGGLAQALACLVVPAATILGHGLFLYLTR